MTLQLIANLFCSKEEWEACGFSIDVFPPPYIPCPVSGSEICSKLGTGLLHPELLSSWRDDRLPFPSSHPYKLPLSWGKWCQLDRRTKVRVRRAVSSAEFSQGIFDFKGWYFLTEMTLSLMEIQVLHQSLLKRLLGSLYSMFSYLNWNSGQYDNYSHVFWKIW